MLRPLVDIVMTVILLLSMSYELIGPVIAGILPFGFDGYEYGSLIHEILGTSLVILFLVHLWLNRWWFRTLFTGRWNLTRTILTLVNLLLIADVILLTVSGLAMSQILDLQETDGLIAWSRTAHVCASYWGYVIMCFHIGLNWHIFSAMMFRKLKPGRIIPHVAALVFMIWGGYAFVRRNLWEYMTMRTEFVFFDFEEPFMWFIADYVAVMVLFACLGHYTVLLLRRNKL
ncbi:MAG: DUF4405 domain-containing protein [Synergistaceae bacterium]|nr:DUF4405 domain-containing protein [Synergistaceae bacterium]